MNENISEQESSKPPEESDLNNNNDDFFSFSSKASHFETYINDSLPKSIKNQKIDITPIFFGLIDNLSKLFDMLFPQKQIRILFSYFISLHHFAVGLYHPGASHTDTEFTSLWISFSRFFKVYQTYLFPVNYRSAIEQMTRSFAPFQPHLREEKNGDEINQSFQYFLILYSNLQDPYISLEAFKTIYDEFTKLKALLKKFCLKREISPLLFNSLSLIEYILNYTSLYIQVRNTIRTIDKYQECGQLSIHLPHELKDHRKFLDSSILIHQIEIRLIYNQIMSNYDMDNISQTPTNSVPPELSEKLTVSLYALTTVLIHFNALSKIRLDNQLLNIWKFYVQHLSGFIDILRNQIINNKLCLPNSQSQTKRNSSQMNLANFFNEISHVNQNSTIFSLYQEFIRISQFVLNSFDQARTLHLILHSITLLIRIINETEDITIKNSASKAADSMVSRLIVAKIRDDQAHFESIIKKLNESKRLYEIQHQLMKQQQVFQTKSQTQQQNSSSSETSPSLKPNQNFGLKIYLDANSDSPFQILSSIADRFREIISSSFIKYNQKHPNELKILTNYSNFLDLIVSMSNNDEPKSEQISPHFTKYQISIETICDCLSKFFNDFMYDMSPSLSTMPPVVFSSFPPLAGMMDPTDMQRISSLLLAERCKFIESRFIINEFIKVNIIVAQINSFREVFTTPAELRYSIETSTIPKYSELVTYLIKLRKTNGIYTPQESKEMAEAIFPLFIKSFYKRALMKMRIEDIIFMIIKTLYVPFCSELYQKCLFLMDFIDNLSTTSPAMNLQAIYDLKMLIMWAFSGSSDMMRMLQTQIQNSSDTIKILSNDLKKNDPSKYEEGKNLLNSFEKFIVLCKLLSSLSDSFKDFKVEKSRRGSLDRMTLRMYLLITQEKGESESEKMKSSDNEDDPWNQDVESQVFLSHNEPYSIPYISILSRVNYLLLLKQKLIKGKKYGLFFSRSSNEFDDFCGSLIKEIDFDMKMNKFYYIKSECLGRVMTMFAKDFDFSVAIGNLISYFDELAVYLANLSQMSASGEFFSGPALKAIKTKLSESLSNIESATEKISSTIAMFKDAPSNTLEGGMAQVMIKNYVDRAQIIITLLLLKKCSRCLEANQKVVQSAMQQQARIQAQQNPQVNISFKMPQQQPQVIQYPPQLQKYGQPPQPLQPPVQFVQTQAILGKPAPNQKFSLTVPIVYNQAQSSFFSPSPSASEANFAVHGLLEISKYVNELPRTPAVASVADKCREMISGKYLKLFHAVSMLNSYRLNSLHVAELSAIKANIKSRICRREAEPKEEDFISFADHLRRCIALAEQQEASKDARLQKLEETVADLEDAIREIDQKLSKDDVAPPEVISAIEEIVDDDEIFKIREKTAEEMSKSDFDKKPLTGKPNISPNDTIQNLLQKVKSASILNQRLRRKVEVLKFPRKTRPLTPSLLVDACPLNLETCNGNAWIANSSSESSRERSEIEMLQQERDTLFEQMVRQNAKMSEPLKTDVIEGMYKGIMASCSSANSASSTNGKVSKSALLSFMEKSDNFFTFIDYDLIAVRKKLQLIKSKRKNSPSEHVAMFLKKLQSFD